MTWSENDNKLVGKSLSFGSQSGEKQKIYMCIEKVIRDKIKDKSH